VDDVALLDFGLAWIGHTLFGAALNLGR
jgi:hypothetical protein